MLSFLLKNALYKKDNSVARKQVFIYISFEQQWNVFLPDNVKSFSKKKVKKSFWPMKWPYSPFYRNEKK